MRPKRPSGPWAGASPGPRRAVGQDVCVPVVGGAEPDPGLPARLARVQPPRPRRQEHPDRLSAAHADLQPDHRRSNFLSTPPGGGLEIERNGGRLNQLRKNLNDTCNAQPVLPPDPFTQIL